MTVAAAHRAPSLGASLAAALGRNNRRFRAATSRTARRIASRSTTIRAAVLQVGGLAGFTATAFYAHPIAGGIVGSTSLFVLNFLLSDTTDGQR